MPANKDTKCYLAIFRPWEILINLVLYFMGAGLANYLAYGVDWQIFWLGFILMTAIMVGGSSLAGYYLQIENGHSLKKTVANTLPGTPQFAGRRRLITYLALVIAGFGISGILTLQLSLSKNVSTQAYFFIAISVILFMLYSVPPIKLIDRGMGEFIWAVEGAFLFPAVAYLLQAGELNRLIVLISLPITVLYLAMELTRSLRPFSQDPTLKRQNTFLGRTGPERGLSFIIYLIAGGYLLAALEGILGLSWTVLWRILISLPIGFFLIWQLHRIRGGGKPNWSALEISAIAQVVFPAYFLSLLFWT